jgi:HEAT repeat protein/S1-C subfamily serine protease
MIEFSCPKCRTVLEASPQQAGNVIKCPECGASLKVPMPKKTPAGQETGLKQSPGRSIPPPAPKPPRREGKTRPAREESAEIKGGPSPALLIGSVVGGVGVLAAIALVVVLVLRTGSKDSKETNSPAAAPASGFNSPAVVKGPSIFNPNLPSGQTKKAEAGSRDDPGPPDVTSSLTSGDIVKQTMQSVVWIVFLMRDGRTGMGSGSLIDLENRIILTNFHVVVLQVKTYVFFPKYEKDRLISEREHYLRRRDEDGILAKVVATDPRHDLALLQLSRVPDGVKAIPLAENSAASLETVYSFGSPMGSGALFGSTSGTVRQVYRRKWGAMVTPGTMLEIDSQIVETQNPTFHGDSGGPLVNDRAELVGVTEGGGLGQLMSFFIDVSEARNFIEGYFQKAGRQWHRGEAVVSSHAAVPDLVRYLDSSKKDFRIKAIANLGKIGSGARLAVPDLIQLLKKESDAGVRRQALEALNKIGPPEKKDLKLLSSGLSDTNAEVRSYAATAVGKLGRDGRLYLTDLLKVKKDSEASVRQAMLHSLGQVGRYDKETVMDALKDGLKDTDRDVRVTAAESVVTLGPSAKDIPLLIDCLKHQDVEVQTAGARALWNLGPEAKEAVGPLVETLKTSKDDQVRAAVVTTLGQIGDAARPAVPAILETLKVKDIRGKAMVALGKIGPEAKEAVPALADSLDDRDNRLMAIEALGKIGKEAKPAVQKMTQLLSERNKDLRLTVLTALKAMGLAAKEAVPAVGKCLDYRDKESKEVSLQALEVLYGLGPDAKPAVDDIIRLFLDEDLSDKNVLRGKAVDTLAKIGKPAVSRLRQALNKPDRYVRLGAANALGQIGSDAKEAAGSLRQMSNSTDPLLHKAAVDALFKIQP